MINENNIYLLFTIPQHSSTDTPSVLYNTIKITCLNFEDVNVGFAIFLNLFQAAPLASNRCPGLLSSGPIGYSW